MKAAVWIGGLLAAWRIGALLLGVSAPAPAQFSANARRIAGIAVCGTAPTSGQVLAYNGTAYCPSAAGTGDVPSSRTIATTSPLAGGGDLSQNRTFSITANGIGFTQLGTDVLQKSVTNLNATQLKALSSSPPTLVAAAGPNTIIVADSGVLELTFGTVAFSGGAPPLITYGTDVNYAMLGGTGCADAGDNILTRTTNTICVVAPNASGSATVGNLINVPLTLKSGADHTAGDGALRITIWYRILSTGI